MTNQRSIWSIKTTLPYLVFWRRKTQIPFRLPPFWLATPSLLAQFGEINSLLSEDEDKKSVYGVAWVCD